MSFINLLLIILSILGPSIEAQQLNYPKIDVKCLNTGNFSSTYKANRDDVFSSLLSNVYHGKGFYNSSSGKTPEDMVYGLYLCRGDASTDLCKKCVTNAIIAIPQYCSVHTTAVIWYDLCVLRYSDQNIFSVLVQDPPYRLLNNDEFTKQDLLNRQMKSIMKRAAKRAAYESPGGIKFVTTEDKISSYQKLYTLVQCTPDLSSQDCDTCLQASIANISGKVGARLLKPSCNVQYEIYAFYVQNLVAALPPDPLTPGLPPGLTPEEKQKKSNKIQVLAASLSAIFGIAVFCAICFLMWRRRNSQEKQNSQEIQLLDLVNEQSRRTFNGDNGGKTQEFSSIKLELLLAATDHFAYVNKLGAGGFGPVYKGTLADGKDIAVKRLSRTSGQGLIEFKNEIMLIAKLQHRNLVRLLGCCLEKNEKLLVYEFMPNRSLDVFLFDSNIAAQLDWQKRFIIIKGIARGILYLHEDSRLKIIHRDLKASNVLLDDKMNPKISDFGLARIFGEDENEADTKRVVGTYGYMAPEYAMEGQFSVKSDVFSFGVLLLEIISGKKNNGFYLLESGESLLSFAWKLWSKGDGMELIDQLLVQSCEASEVLKCIHIGLLCVQDDPSDRPSMSSVIVMLASHGTIAFSRPTEPSFFVGRVVARPAKPVSNDGVISVNEVTISHLSPR